MRLDFDNQTTLPEIPASAAVVSMPESALTIVRDYLRLFDAPRTLEIGCAYGASAETICRAIAPQIHTILDPLQQSRWRNAGRRRLDAAGLRYQFYDRPSEIMLPKLWQQGKRFDFCLIDGRHAFDQVTIELYYLQRLIDKGGIVLIDDADWPCVKQAIDYALCNDAWKIISPYTTLSWFGSAFQRLCGQSAVTWGQPYLWRQTNSAVCLPRICALQRI